jgi:hypothetical protein
MPTVSKYPWISAAVKCTLGRNPLPRRGGGCSVCTILPEFELDRAVAGLINAGGVQAHRRLSLSSYYESPLARRKRTIAESEAPALSTLVAIYPGTFPKRRHTVGKMVCVEQNPRGSELHSQVAARTSIYQASVPSDLGGLKCCASFGRGSNFASIPDPMHFIFAV